MVGRFVTAGQPWKLNSCCPPRWIDIWGSRSLFLQTSSNFTQNLGHNGATSDSPIRLRRCKTRKNSTGNSSGYKLQHLPKRCQRDNSKVRGMPATGGRAVDVQLERVIRRYFDGRFTVIQFPIISRLANTNSFISCNRYLTVEYHIAELLQRSYNSDRESTLRRALGEYEKYLARSEDYELLNTNDKKLYERYVANPSSFSLTQTNDPATRREVKISRFKEEKELKERLEVGIPVI